MGRNTTSYPPSKEFEKQIKTIKDKEETQIKTRDEHGKQLPESNELIKKDFNIDNDSLPLEEQKKYLMNLSMKDLLNYEFRKKN